MRNRIIRTHHDDVRHGCPPWCAQDHQCTMRFGASGQHRSDIMKFYIRNALVVAQRIGKSDGSNQMEFRVVVDLPRQEDYAKMYAQRVLVGVATTIKSILRYEKAG